MNTESQLTHFIKIEQFDGPFHVLVELLEEQKLDIAQVSLAQVTEQYIAAINMQGFNPYTLADFLVVAARLLYLKSKTLLPWLAAEEDMGVSLEEQLKIYRDFHEAAKKIDQLLRERHFSFAREKLAFDIEKVFNPPHNVTSHKLKEVYLKVVKTLEPIVRVPKKITRRVVSLRDKISHIKELIMAQLSANFSDILKNTKNKSDAVVSFLALLELVKQKIIQVEQTERHGEIGIKKI